MAGISQPPGPVSDSPLSGPAGCCRDVSGKEKIKREALGLIICANLPCYLGPDLTISGP